MDFAIPDALRPKLEAARAIIDERVIPREAEVLSTGWGACEALLDELRVEVKAAGLWLPQGPAELGGVGLGVLEHGLMSEVLGRLPLGH